MYTSSFIPGASRYTKHCLLRENNTKCLFLKMKNDNYLKKTFVPDLLSVSYCCSTWGKKATERKNCSPEKELSAFIFFLTLGCNMSGAL